MDISDDLDDLPEIILDSSVAEVEKSFSFEMPDATVLAAQRKFALEQEAEIKKFKEENDYQEIDPEDAVPTEILNELKKIAVITLPVEHPGICLQDLNRMDVVGTLEGPRAVFLVDLIDATELNDTDLRCNLKWYIESIELTILECPESMEADDIHCNVIALCIIYLNKKCRNNVDTFKVQDLMLDLLNRCGSAYQSVAFLHTVTEHILKIVPHMHNRISLARLLNNANLHITADTRQSELFSRKLSMAIMVSSLRDLLGCRQRNYDAFTVQDLRDTVMNAPKWSSLNPYEQYLMMVAVMNLLTTYLIMDVGKREMDESTLKELMLFLASIKSNEKWNNGEFLKVKNLIAKTKLFVQGKPFDHGRSPRKQSPLKQLWPRE